MEAQDQKNTVTEVTGNSEVIVCEVIDLFARHGLTYHEAEMILDSVREGLTVMSKCHPIPTVLSEDR